MTVDPATFRGRLFRAVRSLAEVDAVPAGKSPDGWGR